MRTLTHLWPPPDGFPLHVHAWAPDGPKAVVLILHGLSEHGARYAETALALGAAGYAVYAPDHRGHGASIRSEEERGAWGMRDSFELVVQDVESVRKRIAAKHSGLPIAVLGHSAGSFLALAYVESHPRAVFALALSGTGGPAEARAFFGGLVARFERWRKGPRAPSALLDWLSFGHFNRAFRPVRTRYDWLSRDTKTVDRYLADPLCGVPSSTQLWVDLLAALRRIHRPSALRSIPQDLPIFVFSGAQDPVGERTRGARRLLDRMAAAGLRGVTHRFYAGGRHEMLGETNRAEVRSDVLEWLDAALAQFSSDGVSK